LAGVENLYIWDGADDQGKVAPPGYYIVGIEIFNIDEGSRKYKLPVVLARNF